MIHMQCKGLKIIIGKTAAAGFLALLYLGWTPSALAVPVITNMPHRADGTRITGSQPVPKAMPGDVAVKPKPPASGTANKPATPAAQTAPKQTPAPPAVKTEAPKPAAASEECTQSRNCNAGYASNADSTEADAGTAGRKDGSAETDSAASEECTQSRNCKAGCACSADSAEADVNAASCKDGSAETGSAASEECTQTGNSGRADNTQTGCKNSPWQPAHQTAWDGEQKTGGPCQKRKSQKAG